MIKAKLNNYRGKIIIIEEIKIEDIDLELPTSSHLEVKKNIA